MKLGRRRPLSRPPMLRMRNYLMRNLPAPPATCDWSLNALDFSDVLANDQLGDCTAAGVGHILDLARGNTGSISSVTARDTIAFYSATTGYDPNNPDTDQGGDEITVLNYWRDKGFFPDGGGKIAGYVHVNAGDAVELQTAIWLFGNLYFGVELPSAWISPFPSDSGFIWDIAGAPNPSNGHCFVAFGYDSTGASINSWGLKGTFTYAAMAQYATQAGSGETYCVLPMDWIGKAGQAPSGFDLGQLREDLAALQ